MVMWISHEYQMINLDKLFLLNSKKNFLREKEEKVTYNWCHAIWAPLQIAMNTYISWDTVLFLTTVPHVIFFGPLSFSFLENVLFILPIHTYNNNINWYFSSLGMTDETFQVFTWQEAFSVEILFLLGKLTAIKPIDKKIKTW